MPLAAGQAELAGNDTIIYVQGPGSPSLSKGGGGGDNEFNLADLIISFFHEFSKHFWRAH